MFKRSTASLNSEFSFSQTSCRTNYEEPSLRFYLPIAGGKIDGFMPLPTALSRSETQTTSCKIWTRIADFISYNENSEQK